jgi:two-component system, chemotaxis family, sensor kinase CheA
MEFEVSAELVSIYLEDAREQLAILDDVLLRLEKDGARPELMASVLGPLHTLKGNSGMIGLAAVKDYVHRLEEVFARGRDGTLGLDREALDQLFEAATALRRAIETSCAKDGEPSDLGPAQAALATLLARAADKRGARAAAESAPPEAAPVRLADEARGEAAGPARSSMVRVDFAKLDHLLDLVGELIVHRTKLNELARQVAEALPGAGPELLESVHRVESTATQLQETIMDVRMLPIRHVFERFPRLVRDLARQQGKRVELVLQGEDTRVDKAVIDELGEPLVHLIRNAVDHGIEPPQLRRARGKSETGTLLLSAAQESNQVVITLIDDGAGIDAASVRRKAIERGLLQAGETLSDKDAIQLIFSEGFSTASAVTDVSGRGVGLDVVVRSMERLNALIEAETIPGAGTKFTLQLPLTLAIITVLMVDVGHEVYALPSGAVVESLRYAKKDLVRMNGRDTLRVRDRIVPFVHLAGLFGREERQRDYAYAVIVGRGEKRLGLSVDRLRGQQDVVIKALDAVIATEAVGIAGATILGDGRVVLILDVASLFESRGRARTSGLGRVTAEA